MLTAQCCFYVRTPAAEPGTYYYDTRMVRNGSHDGMLNTAYPPHVGDLIHLDFIASTGGTFRVLQRAWRHSSYGSANWPVGNAEPAVGPFLDVIVEAADGPFDGEVSRTEEEG